MRTHRMLAVLAALPLLGFAGVSTAQAATSPTNPQAPFLVNHGFTSAPYAAPVLAQDGTGVLAVYATPKADGRHLYVSRWTPAHGWGPATQLFVGALDFGFGVQASGGVAAVWWSDLIGSTVRRMHVSVRDGLGGAWSPEHQLFRDFYVSQGDVVVGAGGVTAVWSITDESDPQVARTVLHTQTWEPAHGWGAAQVLAPTVDPNGSGFELAAVGDRVVTSWKDVSGAVDYSVRTAGTWSPAAETASAAQQCSPQQDAGSAQRFVVVLGCVGSGYQTRDWTASSSTPVPAVVTLPGGTSPQVSVAVSGTDAAVVTYSFGAAGTTLLQRSSTPGTWSAATTVTTSKVDPFVALGISGSTVIVAWEEYAPATRSSRILARATAAADGRFTAPVKQVSGWSPKYWSYNLSSLSTGPSGAVLSWYSLPNRTVSHLSVGAAQAATWTSRGSWSAPRTLVAPAYRYHWAVTTAVAGANAMVGWVSPTTSGATAAPLVGPRAAGPAKVLRSGRTLTCTAPAFAPKPMAIAYHWQVNGKVVASTRALTVSGALLGKPLVCRVVASTQGFVPGSAYSPPNVVR